MQFFKTVVFVSCIILRAIVRAEERDLFEEKKEVILAVHNAYRHMHGVPDLQRDPEVDDSAQKWANSLALVDGIVHNHTTIYGENVWMAEGKGATIETLMNDDLNPIKDWYLGIVDYPGFYEPETFQEYAHFTQVVWKSTRLLGVGITISQSGALVVVCHYHPEGNQPADAFAENVPPMLEEYRNFTFLAKPVINSGPKSTANLNWMVLVTCVISVFVR